jgi:hypothetical protein
MPSSAWTSACIYADAFDDTHSLQKLTLETGELSNIPAFDDMIEFNMDVALAQNFFRYISDDRDHSDNLLDDVLFRLYRAQKVIDDEHPFGDNFLDRMACVSTTKYTTQLHKSLPDNQNRHVALSLFGTELAADLFENEAIVRANLEAKIKLALKTKVDEWCDRDENDALPYLSKADEENNPARRAFMHLFALESRRFSVLRRVPLSLTPDKTLDLNSREFYMPLTSGDSIVFIVRVQVDSQQSGIIQSGTNGPVTIPDVVYLLKANLVGDDVWNDNTIKGLLYTEFATSNADARAKLVLLQTAASAKTAKQLLLDTAVSNYQATASTTNRDALTLAQQALEDAHIVLETRRAHFKQAKQTTIGAANAVLPTTDKTGATYLSLQEASSDPAKTKAQMLLSYAFALNYSA